MAQVQDILRDETGDLYVYRGDFKIGESDEQHIEDILIAAQGNYRQHPEMGVNISQYLNAPITAIEKLRIINEIRKQLQADGFVQINIQTQNKLIDLNIDALR